MAAIDRIGLDSTPAAGPDRWSQVASLVSAWSAARGVALRDLTLLLPFAQLLGPARAAFARRGGFLPRIETTRTLAAALGPSPTWEAGMLSFDPALDRLEAARLLARQGVGRDWRRRDRDGFEAAAAQVVDTAHALARAAAAVAPARRAAWLEAARETLAPRQGPGALEQQLARIALEWAGLVPAPATDRLFFWRPAAWAVLRCGGADALAEAILEAADGSALLIDADADLRPAGRPVVAPCVDFEHEAQCAAACVLAHLADGVAPVALVALDRGVVRRVHALLARRQAVVRDETGWKLSTTRAAATVMAALRAAQRGASTDALLDWLKSVAGWPGLADAAAGLRRLEAQWRADGLRRLAQVDPGRLPASARGLWGAASAALAAFDDGSRRPLGDRLVLLGDLLDACGATVRLRADDAGIQVLAALRLDDPQVSPRARLGEGAAQTMDGDEFRRWVDALLEERVFKPRDADDAGPAQVFIVPMVQAMLRPFAAVVCPGADARRLGAWPAPHPLLADGQLRALGLPDAAARRDAEALAFRQLAALPRLTLLHRRQEDGEALVASPLVERLLLAAGGASPWEDPRAVSSRRPAPQHPSAPVAGALVPQTLSAAAVEDLRACPYRFFALRLLRLREADELEADVEKRDYGTWLHEVLLRFHAARGMPADAAGDASALHAIAEAVQAEQRLPDDEFLPFAASFARFVPRYVAWLHARDAAGQRWREGERELDAAPDGLGGTLLRGRIDRIDEARGGALELIDYKTGSPESLRNKVNEPFEDTQLAFYAALVLPRGVPLQAMYLQLDASTSPQAFVHEDVGRSAAALVHGLAGELARVRAGAPLPPLGQAQDCAFCAARGLCRRDHWAEPPEGAA